MPLDICGILVGSPYLYDSKVIFYREKNQYHIFKDGIEYVIHAHRMKTSMSLISVGQMKRLMNVNKNFVMMKPKVCSPIFVDGSPNKLIKVTSIYPSRGFELGTCYHKINQMTNNINNNQLN